MSRHPSEPPSLGSAHGGAHFVTVIAWVLLLPVVVTACLADSASASWSRDFAPEIDIPTGETPMCVAMFDNQLVVSGPIHEINGRVYRGVARWDGERLQPMGDGPGGQILSLLPWRDHLLVAGLRFGLGRNAPHAVVEWDGKEWRQIGEGLQEARELTVWNDRLVVVGAGWEMGSVFLLDGNRWVELPGLPRDWICLAAGRGDLFAGTMEHGVWRWTGTGWVSHGPDPGGGLGRLRVADVGLVAELSPRDRQSAAMDRLKVLASPDGAWLPLRADAQSHIGLLGIWRGRVLVRDQEGSLLTWDGNGWSSVPFPYPGPILAALGDEDNLWVLFEHHAASGVVLNQLARWDGRAWTVLGGGKGVSGAVQAFHSEGGRLLVGGIYDRCGLTAARNLAWWDGRQWAASYTLDQRMKQDSTACWADGVATFATWRGSLYAAGRFASARPGALKVKRSILVRWDGAAWRAVGGTPVGCLLGGSPASVEALSLVPTPAGLAVGGKFCDWGSQELNGITLWDGSACRPIGDAPGCEESSPFCQPGFRCVAPFGAGLIAVGTLRSPDGPRQIGWWRGWGWDFMDGGTDGAVTDLLAWEDRIVAGGQFLRAGDVFTSNVATWDSDRWEPIGSGLPDPVAALGLYDGALVAATLQHPRQSQPLSSLWTWTGSEWTPFRGGAVFEGEVSVLHQHEGDLYVGGRFGSVNGILSESIARWTPE